MYKIILCGTDGSETAEKALGAAARLSLHLSAKLHVIHVPKPDSVYTATDAMAGIGMVSVFPNEEEVKAATDRIFADAQGIVQAAGAEIAETHVRRGDPGGAVAETAKEIGADLVVLGRRGLGSFAGLMVGSTTQRAQHLCHCAVLTVP